MLPQAIALTTMLYEWMNEWKFILYMAYKNFHTKPCVFTQGRTRMQNNFNLLPSFKWIYFASFQCSWYIYRSSSMDVHCCLFWATVQVFCPEYVCDILIGCNCFSDWQLGTTYGLKVGKGLQGFTVSTDDSWLTCWNSVISLFFSSFMESQALFCWSSIWKQGNIKHTHHSALTPFYFAF